MGIEWLKRFKENKLGLAALFIVFLFFVVGVYAPLLASSKPLFVIYNGEPYFPLLRYLFYTEFYTKRLDIFFNIGMFTFPVFLLILYFTHKRVKSRIGLMIALALLQGLFFVYFTTKKPRDPAADLALAQDRQDKINAQIKKHQADPEKYSAEIISWQFELDHMSQYAQLNMLVHYELQKRHHESIVRELKNKPIDINHLSTLWQNEQDTQKNKIEYLENTLKISKKGSEDYNNAVEELQYIVDRNSWLKTQSQNLKWMIMPLIRTFHWEDDAGGQQSLNQYVPWWDLTRINRKDLLAALIFGIRVSLFVGFTAVGLALLIGIPVGAMAGFYGGRTDLMVSRVLEIWEAMPTFFMLLTMVAITQSKSIFLVITVIGLFGWTGFSRYIRGEFFKQRNLYYVEACKALGFRDSYIIFVHILPNAIPPLLTLLPFAVMEAITSEAGLSFLGLGEEGSCSWGVLMDEGRSAFPGESYLLWPPAIMLTILLVAIALVGDRLRDALDPKKAV